MCVFSSFQSFFHVKNYICDLILKKPAFFFVCPAFDIFSWKEWRECRDSLYVEDQKEEEQIAQLSLSYGGIKGRRWREAKQTSEGWQVKREGGVKKRVLHEMRRRDFLLDTTYSSPLVFPAPPHPCVISCYIPWKFYVLVLFAYGTAVAVLYLAPHQVYLYGFWYPIRDITSKT